MVVRALFYSLLSVLVILNGNFSYYWDVLESSIFDDGTASTYDFIVVGGGSAGSIIANRLSRSYKVLLLEAGGYPLYANSIPGIAPTLDFVGWRYFTVPQQHSSFAMKDMRAYWPRGKVLGGTSVINSMLYVRGHPLDYDLWANLTDNEEWKFENVLPYFKKSLDYHGNFVDNEKHYGSTPYGYLHVEKQRYKPLEHYFLEAGKELGFEVVDSNAETTSGFSAHEMTQMNGQRFSSYDAFLKDFRNRQNLRISTYSLATKIKLDKHNRATGVWYLKHGHKKFVRASKEIIVSCGTIESPKLLMLSGIGPKEDLKRLRIKTRVNLPVGKGLKDHLAINVLPFLINRTLSLIPERDFGWETLWNYFVNGEGLLTTPLVAPSGQAFFSTSAVSKLGIDWPNIQLYILALGAHKTIARDFTLAYNLKPGIMDPIFSPIQGNDMFILMPTLVRPKSHGELKLASKDPLQPPLINPNYLEEEDDVKALIEGIKFSIKLAEKTKYFQSLGTKLADDHLRLAACENHTRRSNSFWECYIRHHARTMYHPIGTCRMGKGSNDPLAVVDSYLKVIDVKGLRVADASIMPEILSGNTHVPTMMIGEKALDFIRNYWATHVEVCSNYFHEIDRRGKCYYASSI